MKEKLFNATRKLNLISCECICCKILRQNPIENRTILGSSGQKSVPE